MKFRVQVTLKHINGPEQDEDTMIDAFAAAIGEQNTANPPLTLKTSSGWGEEESTYIVELIDD